MAVSRRRFIRTATVAGAAASAAPHLAQFLENTYESGIANAATAAPSPEAIAMHRMAYGPRPGDIAAVKAQGLDAYIDQQLNPSSIADGVCDQKIADAVFKVFYGTVNELRPIAPMLAKSATDLWAEVVVPNKPFGESSLPWQMVRVATLIRAVYSKRQLQEVMVDFWHNHFNVRPSAEREVSIGFPEHDRTIRQHCFGNFRTFLEAVGRSMAMLYDLDNVSNQAGGGEGGNENYARELFELQTLGSDNYLKFYEDRSQVGTITYNGEMFARGYIDEDVYEVARCFTGWSIASGRWPQPTGTPNTGDFIYLSAWHDTNPKTVLLVPKIGPNGEQIYLPNIPRSQPDLKDGRDVYDMLANHPGTARTICTKLVRRLISDNPPQAVVDAAVAKWMATRTAPDQIKQVLRVILTSQEFKTTWGGKIKRPFEYVVAYLRATEAELPNDVDSLPTSETDPTPDRTKGGYWANIFWNMGNTGHRLFEWPTPTGHPDLASYWGNSNSMLRRWNLLSYLGVQSAWGGNCTINLIGKTDMTKPCAAIVDFWIDRLCGYSVAPGVRQGLIDFLALKVNSGDPSKPPAATKGEDANDPNTLIERLTSTVQLLAMSPDYQRR